MILDEKISSQCLAHMLNHAKRGNNPSEHGASSIAIRDIFKLYQENNPDITIQLASDYCHILTPPSVLNLFRSKYLDTSDELDYISNERLIRENANTIMRTIKPGVSCQITAIDPYLFENAEKNSALHAVCLSGYRVNKEGYMDVQIVDSRYGVYFVSLEHLSSSILGFVTLDVIKGI